MKCEGNFIFKGLGERAGGKFTNEKGQEITYVSMNTLKVDEIVNDKPVERIFKFSKDNEDLKEKLSKVNLYEDIVLQFDVDIYKNTIKLVPTDVLVEHE